MKDYIKMEVAIEQTFETGNTLYLSNVVTHVKAEVEGNQLRDTLSAFNALVKRAGVRLEVTPANATSLRPVLADLNAARLGVSPKRLANIRSLITQAVARFGMQRRWIGNDIELAENWRMLLERVPKREYKWSLSRLACYCSVKGVAPEDVSTQTLLGLHAALKADCTVTAPRKILKATIAVWNMCLKAVPEWPQHKLASPFKTAAFMFPLVDFPQSFQDDVEAWIARNTDVDPLDLDGPVRPLRPVTLDGYVLTFRRLGSALVHTKKLPMVAITDLSILADIDNLKDALRHFIKTVKSDTTNYPHKMANQMAAVARHHLKLPEETLKQIKMITQRLAPEGGTKMGKRNRTRLLQFDDPKAVQLLLNFPEQEYIRAIKINSAVRRAKGVEHALIVSLLIFTGLRAKNIRKIHMTRNIRRVDNRILLEFEADDMKTHAEHVVELPQETIALLEDYIANHRSFLPGADGPYLFPGQTGGARSYSAILNAAKTSVLKHTGLTVSPHLYRHIVAKIVAESHPELLVDVSRRLGHKSFNTTFQSYLGTETPASSKRINNLLERVKAKLGLGEGNE